MTLHQCTRKGLLQEPFEEGRRGCLGSRSAGTYVKKKPIQERAKKIQRWMALYRLYLTSFQDHQGYSTKWSIYPPQCRWSLDQVPAGLYDPKCTYAERGSDRVHIASNGSLRHAL